MSEPEPEVVGGSQERLDDAERLPLAERAAAYQKLYTELSSRLEAVDGPSASD